MAKLSKLAIKNHKHACALLEKTEPLTISEREFVLDNWKESMGDYAYRGAFFTPIELAGEFAFNAGLFSGFESDSNFRVLDLCSGIGRLDDIFACRYSDAEIVCVESFEPYYEVGKRVVPKAKWHCHDATDLDYLKSLGPFDLVISNPPFGVCETVLKSHPAPRYKGRDAEFHIMDVASQLAPRASFIIPLTSKPTYEGCTLVKSPDKYQSFVDQTGLKILHFNGIDDPSGSDFLGFENTPLEVTFANIFCNPKEEARFAA